MPLFFVRQRQDRGDPEGWEFSSLIGWQFHRLERSSDTFRRRRWRRKMAPEDRLGASAIFQLEGALVRERMKIAGNHYEISILTNLVNLHRVLTRTRRRKAPRATSQRCLVPILPPCPASLAVRDLTRVVMPARLWGVIKMGLSVLFCSTGSHVYHLRVYMYQARNLTSMDKDSFSGKNLVFNKS